MKITGKIVLLALAAVIGLSVASPARADWYDGRYHHRGHYPRGYYYDPRLGYYVYNPYYVAPPPTVVYAPPPPAYYAPPPAPVYAGPPVGLSLGVHIH